MVCAMPWILNRRRIKPFAKLSHNLQLINNRDQRRQSDSVRFRAVEMFVLLFARKVDD